MSTIKIEINTESSNPVSVQQYRTHSLATPLIQGIGIVSSIDYDAEMTTAFNAGLLPLIPTQTSPPSEGYVYIPPALDKLKFQPQDIITAIQQHNDDADIGLIVTFGGNFTWSIANQYATKPFISLLGGVLPNMQMSPFFAGGVTLNSYETDPARIADLVNVKPKVLASEIWLLYDPRTLMANQELKNWTGGGTIPATNGIGDPTKFNLDFENIPNAAKAVVISAAPYFLRQRNNLIPAANASNLYVCYPLLRYRNSDAAKALQPTHGVTTLLGPDLCEGAITAYGFMGSTANTVLSGQTPDPVLMPAPQRTIHW
jgi:hypothetical protein